MNETTSACIRGCAMYGQHYVECEDRERCRGCLPQRASKGNLCQSCARRLELMIFDAPTVIRWLTGNMRQPSASSLGADFITGSKGDGPPVPLKIEMLDVRELMTDRLALWVDDWCEFKGLTGPGRHTPEVDSTYLLTWFHGVCHLEWIGDWWTEMAETMSVAHALAPWRPMMRRLPGVPCPGCAETNLAIYGGESDITCLSCRIMMTEDRFEMWQRVLKHEREVAS